MERERGDDPLHAPAAVVGALPRSRGAAPRRAQNASRAVADDPVMRARHLALATDGLTDAVAAASGRRGGDRRRSRRICERGRAGRGGAAADAGRTTPASATVGRLPPLAPIAPRGMDARADDRDASCSRTAGSARCAPTCCSSSPSSRVSTAPSRCSRKRCRRRRRDRRCRRASSAGWRGRHVSRGDSAARSSTPGARLELADEVDDDALRVRGARR